VDASEPIARSVDRDVALGRAAVGATQPRSISTNPGDRRVNRPGLADATRFARIID